MEACGTHRVADAVSDRDILTIYDPATAFATSDDVAKPPLGFNMSGCSGRPAIIVKEVNGLMRASSTRGLAKGGKVNSPHLTGFISANSVSSRLMAPYRNLIVVGFRHEARLVKAVKWRLPYLLSIWYQAGASANPAPSDDDDKSSPASIALRSCKPIGGSRVTAPLHQAVRPHTMPLCCDAPSLEKNNIFNLRYMSDSRNSSLSTSPSCQHAPKRHNSFISDAGMPATSTLNSKG